MIVVQNWVENGCILAGIRVRTFPLNSSLSVCDMNGSFQTTVGVHRKGFFFPNLHFQLVYRNLIANELCKLGCTYMVRTILFLTQFKWSSLLTCRDNECCSTGCHIRFGGEWVCLSGYQVRTFPLNSSLSVCDMNVVLFKLQLVCTGRFFFQIPVSVQEFDS